MKKKNIIIGLVVLVLLAGAFVLKQSSSEDLSGKLRNKNGPKPPTGTIQTIPSNQSDGEALTTQYFNDCMSSSTVTDIINNQVITQTVPKAATAKREFCQEWAEYWYARIVLGLSANCADGETTSANNVPIVSEDGGITRNLDGSLRTQTINYECQNGQWEEGGTAETQQPAN